MLDDPRVMDAGDGPFRSFVSSNVFFFKHRIISKAKSSSEHRKFYVFQRNKHYYYYALYARFDDILNFLKVQRKSFAVDYIDPASA